MLQIYIYFVVSLFIVIGFMYIRMDFSREGKEISMLSLCKILKAYKNLLPLQAFI